MKLSQMSQQVNWLNEAVKRLQDEINRLRLFKGGDDGGTVSDCPYG